LNLGRSTFSERLIIIVNLNMMFKGFLKKVTA